MGEPKAANPKTWLIVMITVALLGCLGTTIAALIGILPQLIETRASPESILTETINAQPGTETDVPSSDEPTNTLPQISTDVPTTPNLPETSPDTVLEVGRIWREDGLELIVPEVRLSTDSPGPGITLSVRLVNQRGQDFILRYSIENFSASDNLGRQQKIGAVNTFYGDFYEYLGHSIGTTEILISPGNTYNLAAAGISTYAFDKPGMELFVKADIGDPDITENIFQISGISGIDNARWRIPINH